MNKNLQQSGRSMVEMLGVLAVIGVLSVGGIVGYRNAMAQNEANDFINALMIDFTQIKGMLQNDSINLDYTSFIYESSMPEYIKEKEGNDIFHYFGNTNSICNMWMFYLSKSLCQKLKNYDWNVFKNTFGADHNNGFFCDLEEPTAVIDMCVYK